MRRLASALALLAVLAAPAAATAKRHHRPWRCNGQAALCDRPFDHVVLPAAHNAMSAASLGWAIPNQPVGIPEQLRDGIRGFLIDTHYGHDDGTGTIVTDATKTIASGNYLCHEVCQIGATPLRESLAAMRRFLQRHPHQVLLLDVEDYISAQDFAAVARITGLAHYVYRGAPGPQWPTLRHMIRHHQQVVVLNEHAAVGVPWIHLDYDGIVQETGYNWNTADQITSPANWPSSCAPNRGGTTGSLFLMNHWSPPVAPTPAGSAIVNAEDTLVGRALACRDARGKMPTLVAVDMYRSGGLFPAVRRLNRIVGQSGG